MLIIDELPFKFVENEGFQKFMAACCSRFKILSRSTITRDCLKTYFEEMLKLKTSLKEYCQRVNLTTAS